MEKYLKNSKLAAKDTVSHFLFFVALVLLLFVDYISATSIPHLYTGRVFQATIILLGIKILMTQYTWREWLVLGVGGVVAVASYFSTGSYFVCLLIMLIMASKGISLRPIMKAYFWVVSCMTFLVMVLAASGICGEMYIEKDFRDTGIEIRYCMGYTHPNTFHIILLQLILVGIWLLWDKMKWYYFILLFGLNIIAFYFTLSRTNVILGSFMLVALMVLKCYPQLARKTGIYIFGGVVYLGCIVLSILAALGGHTLPVLDKINQLWTNRMFWAYTERMESKLTLFSGADYHIRCDMGFVSNLYNYGVVIAILIILLMTLYLLSVKRNNDYLGLVGFIVCIILFTGETFVSGEYVTRNLLYVFMLGWGTYESGKLKKLGCGKEQNYVSAEKSDS